MLTRPMETPTLNVRWFTTKRKSAIDWRSVSAIRTAGSTWQFSSSTPNSSHPRRGSVPPSRSVAPPARQGVPVAQPLLQHDADLAHEFVARAVATGVVHDLELIKVEIHH